MLITKAELLILFHQTNDGKPRTLPFAWAPDGATASIPADPRKSEVILVLKQKVGGDIQIKIRQETLAIAFAPKEQGLNGIAITETGVSVDLADSHVALEASGNVVCIRDDGQDHLRPDGSLLKTTHHSQVFVSATGSRMTRVAKGEIETVSDKGHFRALLPRD